MLSRVHAETKQSRSPTRIVCILLLSLVSTLFAFNVAIVNAPGGLNLVLSSLPSRIQEGATGGVQLVLNVTNASTLTAYTINWSVTDPSGITTTSTNSTTTTTGTSFVIFTRYPAAFGGSVNLAGTYNVSVSATPLLGTPVVTTGHFQVGLTDNTTYQRTALVLVKASGYLSLDNVTINLTQGPNPVPNFPTIRRADTNGLISLTWQTLVGSALGTYLLTMSGTSTPPKTPADSQTFAVTPTNATIGGIWLNKTSVERSQTVEFRFNATYLNGSPVTSGSATLLLTEPDGITTHVVTASYDSPLKTLRGFYASTLGSATGVWTGTINVDSFDDGFGNGGPLSPVVTTLSIQTASLTVTAATYNATYTQGKIIPLYAKITAPSGATFTQGTVSATITSFGQRIVGPLGLIYNASSTEWSGGYRINATDPSGTWKMAIVASDGYGNSGQNSTSLFVNTPTPPLGPPGQSPQPFSVFSSWIFWLLVLVLVAVGFGILIFKRRGAFHREVKIDVQAIKHQADQVKGDDFLQSIQAQLKRRTERMAAEKEKERHD